MSQPHKRDLKLELTWVGKDNARPRLEPRILVYDDALSHTASARVSDHDQFDNLLIFGDNLLALKALTTDPKYRGQVKCIFIDPPYNTGSAFEHYDDGLEHSIWLGMMRERLELLRELLREDGSIWISIDDNEAHYLKVLCDEIFGRSNFINQVSVRTKQAAGASGGGEDKKLKKNVEYVLIYCKNKFSENGFVKFNDFFEEEDLMEFIQFMKDEGKSWKYTRVIKNFGDRRYIRSVMDGQGEEIKIYEHTGVEIKTISDICREDGIDEQEAYLKYFESIFRDTNAQSSIRTRILESSDDLSDFISIDYIPRSGRNKGKEITLYYKGVNRDLIAWLRDIAVKKSNRIVKLEKLGTYWDGFPLNNLTKEGGVHFPNGKKPEALLQRIIHLATNPGDLVLDSFAGSGTTGAVAHKMGRRWVMVELGEHAHTHIIPRMQKVIDGADAGGITASVGWGGGGGFRYARLAPSLLEKDQWGQYVISKQYNAAQLAEACCKIEGFSYAPSQTEFWRHGQSTESDFIYVTTSYQTEAMLQEISEAVGPERTLLILATAYDSAGERLENLTLKKIPQSILRKCDWGHDDYSLNVRNLPSAPQVDGAEPEPAPVAPKRGRKSAASSPPPMLAMMTEGGEQ